MCTKQWKSIVAKGDNAVKNKNAKHAIICYKSSIREAERMIDASILNFDGDTNILSLYTRSCHLLVDVCRMANKRNDAITYMNEAMNKLLSVIKNPGYPILMRGKSIRAFEALFTIVNESELETPSNVITNKLYELSTYIKQMLPVDRDIQRN